MQTPLKKQKHVIIHSDGACLGNPGPGGWGAVLEYRGRERELSGGEAMTTNNRMELTAVIKALSELKEPCDVTVYTDSRYVADAVTKGWVKRWRAAGWMRSKKEGALNPDLWEELLALTERHRVSFIWIRGHAENEKNIRADALAVSAAKEVKDATQ